MYEPMKYGWVDSLKDDFKGMGRGVAEFFKGLGCLLLGGLCLSLIFGIIFLVIKMVKWMWIHA